jgi:soluble lytic murein transglycosylase-like protein
VSFNKLFFLLFLFCAGFLNVLEARRGKIFFYNGRHLEGDIQTQKDDSGQKLFVIALPSGSMTFKKSEVKNVIYTAPPSKTERLFQDAFYNTPSKSSAKKICTPYESHIKNASEKHQMDPDLIKAVIKQESNFNPADVSNKGAIGLMQLMPETARGLGVQNAFDPYENIHAGTRFLRIMLENFNGDLEKALAAYNAGPGAVRKYGAIPPYKETQNYVRKVLKYYSSQQDGKLFTFKGKKGELIFTDQPYLP